MRKLRKFFGLKRREQFILCRAAVLLVASEVCLRLFPPRQLLDWVQSTKSRGTATETISPDRIAWLVEAAAQNLWVRSTCLPQSLVLCRLLRASGREARLVVGTRCSPSSLEAHAWVEWNGKILGSRGARGYEPLASFNKLDSGQELA